MTNADRWLLPDGIEEILPEQARQIEHLRRQLLDLYQRWGYSFVIPPMVEFTDSLLTGTGKDLELMTFKVTDQLSGRMMGIRADFTPQIARIDAHSLRTEGPSRLCYAGHVLYTKPPTQLATRAPIKSGIELFGVDSLAADVEVMSLLLQAMDVMAIEETCLEIGHVGIFQSLVDAAKLSAEKSEALFDLLRRKAIVELKEWVTANVTNAALAEIFKTLPTLAGDRHSLIKAKQILQNAPKQVLGAIEELENVSDQLLLRFPAANLYFDLSEPHSFNYHTGIVFSAFANGYGKALASGGRYDHVGEVFGRARPATGFSLDVTAANRIIAIQSKNAESNSSQSKSAIFYIENGDSTLFEFVQQLRSSGEKVIAGFDDGATAASKAASSCDRKIEKVSGQYQVIPFQ